MNAQNQARCEFTRVVSSCFCKAAAQRTNHQSNIQRARSSPQVYFNVSSAYTQTHTQTTPYIQTSQILFDICLCVSVCFIQTCTKQRSFFAYIYYIKVSAVRSLLSRKESKFSLAKYFQAVSKGSKKSLICEDTAQTIYNNGFIFIWRCDFRPCTQVQIRALPKREFARSCFGISHFTLASTHIKKKHAYTSKCVQFCSEQMFVTTPSQITPSPPPPSTAHILFIFSPPLSAALFVCMII